MSQTKKLILLFFLLFIIIAGCSSSKIKDCRDRLCFYEAEKECIPAKIIENTKRGDKLQWEIIGEEKDDCLLQMKAIKWAISSELEGKSMKCKIPKSELRMPLFSDNIFNYYDKCEGRFISIIENLDMNEAIQSASSFQDKTEEELLLKLEQPEVSFALMNDKLSITKGFYYDISLAIKNYLDKSIDFKVSLSCLDNNYNEIQLIDGGALILRLAPDEVIKRKMEFAVVDKDLGSGVYECKVIADSSEGLNYEEKFSLDVY